MDDLICGARALSSVAPDHRPALAERLLDQAHAADAYAKRFQRPHPRWGNGSLMARALAEPVASKASFAAIAVMAAAIAAFRVRNLSR